jgi:hypothetical protein
MNDAAQKELDKLPEDDIPDCVKKTFTYSAKIDTANVENSSYVPEEKSQEDSEEIKIDLSGVVDDEGSLASSEEQVKSASNDVMPNLFAVKSGSVPISAWDNPEFWTLAFPTLFPYGVGGLDEKKTSIETWSRFLLNHEDTRFATHYSFMFVVFSILQIRTVCKQSKFSIRYLVNSAFARVDSKMIKEALECRLKNIKSHISLPVHHLLQNLKQRKTKNK